jgi:hypothetical protein
VLGAVIGAPVAGFFRDSWDRMLTLSFVLCVRFVMGTFCMYCMFG